MDIDTHCYSEYRSHPIAIVALVVVPAVVRVRRDAGVLVDETQRHGAALVEPRDRHEYS